MGETCEAAVVLEASAADPSPEEGVSEKAAGVWSSFEEEGGCASEAGLYEEEVW